MTDTMTRDVVNSTYRATAPGNPPPLHVRADTDDGSWCPVPRAPLAQDHPGPVMVVIPSLPADVYGEDPTDPAACHQPRIPTAGMVGRLALQDSTGHNIGVGGVRR